MRVITAPEQLTIPAGAKTVFLAGGITNCPWWQTDIIHLLTHRKQDIIFNPRRHNFPIDNPDASVEQITWEFEALNMADIFSIWFCASSSVQPICMYELGRHLAIRAEHNELHKVIIGIEPGYTREQDVRIQTKLVAPTMVISSSLLIHALRIEQALDSDE